jgi:hypothetical protein
MDVEDLSKHYVTTTIRWNIFFGHSIIKVTMKPLTEIEIKTSATSNISDCVDSIQVKGTGYKIIYKDKSFSIHSLTGKQTNMG